MTLEELVNSLEDIRAALLRIVEQRDFFIMRELEKPKP